MSKSIAQSLADAAAISAANTARQHADNARMQEIARNLAQRAANTR